MRINLKSYLEEREHILTNQSIVGPVVTISRNYGCDEAAVIQSLLHKHNQLDGGLRAHSRKYIDKEILEESASELGIKVFDVDHRVLLHHSEIMNDLLASFRPYYGVPDKKIIEKVREITTTYADNGNVIIVGRGGVGVTKTMGNGLHIKLTAPIKYRIE